MLHIKMTDNKINKVKNTSKLNFTPLRYKYECL